MEVVDDEAVPAEEFGLPEPRKLDVHTAWVVSGTPGSVFPRRGTDCAAGMP